MELYQRLERLGLRLRWYGSDMLFLDRNAEGYVWVWRTEDLVSGKPPRYFDALSQVFEWVRKVEERLGKREAD
jgi:hypothetical protein